jgi:hypothetical protein
VNSDAFRPLIAAARVFKFCVFSEKLKDRMSVRNERKVEWRHKGDLADSAPPGMPVEASVTIRDF